MTLNLVKMHDEVGVGRFTATNQCITLSFVETQSLIHKSETKSVAWDLINIQNVKKR